MVYVCRTRHLVRPTRNPMLVAPGIRSIIAAVRKDRMYTAKERERRPEQLATVLDASVDEFRLYLREIEPDDAFNEAFASRGADLESVASFKRTALELDCHTMYATVRAVGPTTAIETGCRYRAFDVHIVRALKRNRLWMLHRIDLPGGLDHYD